MKETVLPITNRKKLNFGFHGKGNWTTFDAATSAKVHQMYSEDHNNLLEIPILLL